MIDFIFSNESEREPTREDLHINKRQSGGVTNDMAAGRDKETGAKEEDSGDFVGSVRFHMTTEGSHPSLRISRTESQEGLWYL